MNKIWSNEDVEFIKQNAEVMKDEALARELEERSGRKVSVHALRKQRQKLGLKKKPGRGVCRLREIN